MSPGSRHTQGKRPAKALIPCTGRATPYGASDFHDFLFLGRGDGFDFLDILVGQGLDILVGLLLLVLGHFGILLHGLGLVVGVPADVPGGDLGFLLRLP